jgi:hypothetical protein
MASTKQAWASGGTIFAGTLLLIIGVYQFFVGLAAVVQDNFFVVGPNYTYQIDTTAWGWIHMAIGVLAAVAGFLLFTGATWARVAGIAILAISAIANFFFLPYYPLWSALIIGLDIFAIWAIATVRAVDELVPPGMAMGAGAAGSYRGEAMQSGERWPAGNVAPAGTSGGRHWAPEDVKEGARDPAAEARERAEAAARGESGTGTYTAGSGGVTPPTNPPPAGNP